MAKGNPIGGMSANAATISSAATSTSINFMLEDQRATNWLVEDEFVSGSKTTSFSSFATSTFSVNYPNEVLLLFGTVVNNSTTAMMISSIIGGSVALVNGG